MDGFECRMCANEWCLCTKCHAAASTAAAALATGGTPTPDAPAPHPHLLTPNSGPQHMVVELGHAQLAY